MSRVQRDPEISLGFIKEFHNQIGLRGEQREAKEALLEQDAFQFYRALPALFFRDLAGPFASIKSLLGCTAPQGPIFADSHIGNFGTNRGDWHGGPVKDTPAIWGPNDFDQTGLGSPEWDLERLAASVVLLARKNGLTREEQNALVATLTQTYFAKVSASGAASTCGCILGSEATREVAELIEKADEETRGDFLKEYTENDDGYYFRIGGELQELSDDSEYEAVVAALRGNYQDRIQGHPEVAVPIEVLDVVAKLESGGSTFDLKRYYVLVGNRDPDKKPYILEVKQLLPSPIEFQDGNLARANGAEVLDQQGRLGGRHNSLSGTVRMGGLHFLVREHEPEKKKLKLDEPRGADELEDLVRQAAKSMARAHTAVPGRAEALAQWLGDDAALLKTNLTQFAGEYADQAEADYQAFLAR